MEIISHRGLWENQLEKNSKIAFQKSFANKLGTETDLRDFNGRIVISHDVPDTNSLDFDFFLSLYLKYPKNTLALNIKADGLASYVKELLEKNKIDNYFVFDMSIPDTINYINLELNFCIRQSEYELTPPFYEKCKGIWLDSFETLWFDKETILHHISNNKKVCIVSPELHKREYKSLWQLLLESNLYKNDNVILCTDFPIEAIKYFNL